MNTSVGETSFAVLLFQDIAVIPILVLMPLLAVTNAKTDLHSSMIAHYSGYMQALIIAAVIAGVILGGGVMFHIIYFAPLQNLTCGRFLLLFH
jgi:Kef-type K+ transport system membrane component KefB